ncbi:MAG: hypothetical protein FJZ38_23830 [Candidatus Rokubacteria bacterium]|nr:hypothetical protein [Candidatus Rokubacteria bacterium]
MALREFPMAPRDPAVAIEGIRQFLELHATCYGISVDTPPLPRDGEYRAVIACRCGDTIEYWLADAKLPRQHLVAAVSLRPAA